MLKSHRFTMTTQKLLASWIQRLLLCVGLAYGNLAFGGQLTEEPQPMLEEIGLGSLEIISESQASDVKGQGIGSSGTSMLIGSLVDPATGSTANFFQIESSGATGTMASHSNLINASFGWTIGGIFQRFQAEVGGFGFAFSR